ncbi:MAG: hypothetical protein K8R48_06325 [Alphaproteobacteria bacterium]|nr:hypothetical protein [Alphaproteobacteria bacterium]
MSEFTEKQPGDKTFQLSGIFCFHSPRRGGEYDASVYKYGHGMATVNYYGTLLSDGTPGGLAGDTFVRPDDPGSYVLIGKVVPNPGGPTVLEEVNLAKEIALQSGLPYEEPRQNPPPSEERRAPAQEEYNKRAKHPRTKEQLEREKKQRKVFNSKSSAKIKHYINKYTTKIK